MIELKGRYTGANIMIDEVEEACLQQIRHMINHPAFSKPVVIMPDTHAGKGSVIGFTMPLTEKVIPNVIGVDIGCGMLSVPLGKLSEPNLPQIDQSIKSLIPMGFSTNSRPRVNAIDYQMPNHALASFVRKFNDYFGTHYMAAELSGNWLDKKLKQIDIQKDKFLNSLGTLGGGNHFIELGRSEKQYYLTIHSGSRHFGLRVASYWQGIAKKEMSLPDEKLKGEIEHIWKSEKQKKQAKKKIRELKRDQAASFSKELAYLEGENMMQYLFDMVFAQYYASLNRKLMMDLILDKLKLSPAGDAVESVHNYIDFKDLVIRKGAISSYESQQMIIPFNMRDGLLICEGKSNKDWNYSAPHGAGRLMSRSKAKKTYDLDLFKKTMKGVYSTSIKKSTIDEAPFVYKDAALIERLISPTAKVLERVKPILNIKAD